MFVIVSHPSSGIWMIYAIFVKVAESQGLNEEGHLRYLFDCKNCYQKEKTFKNQITTASTRGLGFLVDAVVVLI